MKYEERIICFIDILGFSQHVENTINKDETENESKIEIIADALKSMEEIIFLSLGPYPRSRKITQFSDSIVISFNYEEPDSIFYTLLDIQLLVIEMAYRGFLCRGGIVLGKIIHDNEMVFGPGMIDAYTLESRAANYPRIILDKSILQLANLIISECPLFDLEKSDPTGPVGFDSDGMYYINYFSPELLEFNKSEYSFTEFMNKLHKMIESGIKTKKQDIYVKYSWLKEKYNNFVYVFNSFPERVNTQCVDITEEMKQIGMIE